MHERDFFLVPLVEIAPDVFVPGSGRAAELLLRVDQSGIERIGS
jgi:2-amino-4-hydroxy-6-hydroxymethyldihydropteridine diphosphokinase